MTTLNFETTVNVSKQEAWIVQANFAGISIFHPVVPKSYAINNSEQGGLGAERRCELNADGSKFIDERIVRFVDGQEYDVEIYGGNQIPPVNNLIVTIGLEEVSTNQTRIYLVAKYEPKYSFIGTIMDTVMIKPFLTKAMNGILAGFKHHMETGETVQSFQTLKLAGLIA